MLQVLYGRNDETNRVVAAIPADSFHYAFMSSKIALEHIDSVILLTRFIYWKRNFFVEASKLSYLPEIQPNFAKPGMELKVTAQHEVSKARYWSVPGVQVEHRNGGLEKIIRNQCNINDPMNHQKKLVDTRQEKIDQYQQS